MTDSRFERALPAVAASIPQLRHDLTGWARCLGLDEDTLAAVRLATTEAMTNAVVHGFIGRSPGTLQVIARPGGDTFTVRIRDDGRGMGPRPDSPGLGMGLPLIGKLCLSVDLGEGPGGVGTEVRMVFAAPGLETGDGRAGDVAAIMAALARVGASESFEGPDIGALAELVVPALADVCSVTLLDGDGVTQRVGARVARADGTIDEDAATWMMAFPTTAANSPSNLAAATGRTTLQIIDEEWVRTVSPDPANAEVLGALGLMWWAAVPLRAGELTVGSIAVAARAERGPPEPILAEAERIAEQAGALVATARLLDGMRRNRRRLERIVGALSEAVTVNDADGRIVYANAAAVELLGVPDVAALIASEPGDLAARFRTTDADGAPVSIDALPHRRMLAGALAEPLLTRSVRRDNGRARWLLTTTTLLDEEGPLVVNVIQDVTASREAELRSRLLADTGDALARSLDPEEALRRIARFVVPVLADGCAIDLFAPDGSMRRVAAHHVEPERAAALAAGGPIVAGASASVSMTARGRDHGVMTLVYDASERVVAPDVVELATDLARRAAVAVDNARLLAERAATQAELAAGVNRMRLLSDAGFAGLVSGAGREIREANAAFLAMVGYGSVQELPPWVDMTPPHWADADRRALAELRRDGVARAFTKEYLRRDGTAVPVLIAVALVEPEAFEWVGVVVDLTERRAADEQRARLLDRVQRLQGVSEALGPVLRTADVARVVLEASVAALDAEAGLLGLTDGVNIRTVGSQGYGPERTGEVILPMATRMPLAEAVRRRELVHVHGDADWDARYPHIPKPAGLPVTTCVPLLLDGAPVGALAISWADGDRVLGPEDEQLVLALARQAAQAIERSRLYEERVQAERILQARLLPAALPEVPGLRAAAGYWPMGTGDAAGGDFYDLIRCGDGWLAVIGDVCGKGTEAAVVTGLVRNTLRGLARVISEPARLLDELNAAMLDEDVDRFATVIVAVLRGGEAGGRWHGTLATAGHPAPVLVRDGAARALDVPIGCVLGVFESLGAASCEFTLEPGETLTFFTDGVVEARVDGGHFGDARLHAELEAAGSDRPEAIVAAVEAAVRRFQPGPPRDDKALLVLQAADPALAVAPVI